MAEEADLIVLALDKSRPTDERTAALERLVGLENPSYDLWRALCSIFNDEAEGSSVRVAAVRAMGKRFPAAAPNQLCRYIAGDPDRRVRREAVTVLQEIGRVPERMEPRLERDLLSLSKETKPHILLNLAMHYGRDPRVLAALRDAAHNAEVEIRAIAIQGLGMLGEMNDVINAIHDNQPQARVSAAETLGYYGVLEPVETAALEGAVADSDEAVRRAAKTALRRLGVQKTPKAPQKPAAAGSTAPSKKSHFDWESLLNKWNQGWLDVHEYAVELPDEVIASGWLGYRGAREKEITSAEQRLGITLPPSYREFLQVTNGWRRTSPFIERVWSVEQVKSFAVENQEWIDIWRDTDPDCPEARYLPSAAQISEVGDASVYLLMPELASGNGECEVWLLASWRGTAVRYDSFWDLMQAEYATFKSIEQPGKIKSP